MRTGERLLLLGGILTAIAALLHVAIIAGGAEWYRFFGAGERMAHLAERGSSHPAIVTAGIAAVLALWALYAFSGAGMIRPLPWLRVVLALIAVAYLGRAVLGVPYVLMANSAHANELRGRMTFIVLSSLVCLALGLCYAVGAMGLWREAPRVTLSSPSP